MKKITTLLVALTAIFTLSLNAQNAWINEIHYDNASTDVDEIIEVVIENPGSYTLSLFQVDLYNGNGGGVYGSQRRRKRSICDFGAAPIRRSTSLPSLKSRRVGIP